MKYIVTNFVYGTGPYLRTTELALAINNEMEKRGKPRFGIIVPWVYGEKQKRIMLEEFGDLNMKFPGEIWLCSELGKILNTIFYGNNTYEQALKLWVSNFEKLNSEAKTLLSGKIELESMDGEKKIIEGSDILIELSRAGRIKYGIKTSYGVTFGNTSEILKNTLTVPEMEIAVDRNLVREAIAIAENTESQYKFTCVAYPGTFSFLKNRTPVGLEISIPPTIYPPQPNSDPIQEGIFITITGIPGLERLYNEAKDLGLKLYSNDPSAVPGSERLLPNIIPNPKIKLQFARSGWGSVWLSQLSGTPFVCPEFDPLDDPEIYFNNICIEKLGLGIVYRGQPLSDILKEAEILKPNIRKINQEILDKFGTYDGNEYSSKIIVDDLLSSKI
ncbi:MAG: hypothetical protein AAB861_00315 [Patescibacteria group bacterium]